MAGFCRRLCATLAGCAEPEGKNSSMKRANLIFGLVFLTGFLISGYYMAKYFRPAHMDELTVRMQIRASHIYLLFIALLNLIAFKCELTQANKSVVFVERIFRFLLIAAGCIAIAAFVLEHTGHLKERKLTLLSVVLSLASIVVILLHETLISLKERRSV